MTRQGWLVAAVAVALVVAGRLFGIFELFLVGTAAATLVLVCTVRVGLTRLRLDVSRELHPPRTHAGSPSRVQLEVRNRSSRRTPLLHLRDPVGSGRSATVVLAPLGGGESVHAAYRLPTERRGIVRIGPLQVEVSDPFGLAAVSTPAAPVAELTVWPAIEPVTALPHTHGDDPHGGADVPNALSNGSDDFHALRPYVVGDDLRRVHWPSTARSDDLMIRQDERPWESRGTVVLDIRRAAHHPAGFERAVAAAASVVVACSRRHYLIRLVTTAGYDSGFGSGAAHVEAIMEQLAIVETTTSGDLATVVALLRRSGGGALAVLLGDATSADAEQVFKLRRAHGHATVVAFRSGQRPAGGGEFLAVDDTRPFGEVWNRAMASSRGGPRPMVHR